MDFTQSLSLDTQFILSILATEHTYAMDAASPESSERTRGVSSVLTLERDSEMVDAAFLERAGPCLPDVMRPVECLIGYPEYRKRLHTAMDAVTELESAASHFFQLPRFLEDHDGTILPVSWPPNKYLRLTCAAKLGYREIINALRHEYKVCDSPTEVLGVILSPGQSIYSDVSHPVLLLTMRGTVLVHIRGRPVWNSDYNPDIDCEQLYVAAESLRIFGRDGLSRCDPFYTESGGAPYAMPEDPVLKHITQSMPTSPIVLIKLLSKWQGHCWSINGCPGMLKDRLFMISFVMPSFVREALSQQFDQRFVVIGRVFKSRDDIEDECEMYILVDCGGMIYGYIPDTGRMRRLAISFDQFLRMGTRRMYFNFQVQGTNTQRNLDDPTFIVHASSGFFLLPRQLLSVKRTR